MPGKIKTRIICARNLPIMDRSSDSSDAFVEVRFGANNYDKTQVYRKSLDPEWNSRFVFEVEEDEIQEEPLQIRVLDHDTYSSHDAIGKVYIDLKPLLNPNGPTSINGFIPIYDTLHGIRGEIKIQAKIEIFNDCNEYRKSSCGVQFFCSSKIPDGYVLQNFCGFVEELIINDDPEYQWIDKIRTPRTSNETRQKLFTKLSGEVQRRIGLKVLEMDANCVLGYQQNFDLEGEHGIVVRGIGTAAHIYKNNAQLHSQISNNNSLSNSHTPILNQTPTPPLSQNLTGNQSKQFFFSNNNNHNGNNNGTNPSNTSAVNSPSAYPGFNPNEKFAEMSENGEKIAKKLNFSNHATNSNSNFNNGVLLKLNKISPNRGLSRIHSDSDLNSYQHHQQQHAMLNNNPNNNDKMGNNLQYGCQNSLPLATENRQSILDKMDYPFLTIQQYPIGFIKSLCGIVCARSVKLLSSSSNSDDLDARDKYWLEIRNEIRSHMKSLNCHVVLGYIETKSICEDVCVLSAMGTAAIVDESFFCSSNSPSPQDTFYDILHQFNNNSIKSCKLLHVPYSDSDPPFPVALSTCAMCGQGQVPDIIFSSIQPLPEIETIGQGCSLRAVVTRPRKKSSGEISAKVISDYLPFMEYELHRQLLGKLKLKGMNMLYGLQIQISIGENVIIGMAEATACYAAALPSPMIPKIVSEKGDITKKELEEIESLKKLLNDEINLNKAFFNLDSSKLIRNNSNLNSRQDEIIQHANQQQSNNSNTESKALFKIELDDVREKDNVYLLLDSKSTMKKGFYTCSTEYMPGIDKFTCNLQMFTNVYRCETSLVQMNTKKFNEICDDILESLRYKFRKYQNCCLLNLSFDNSLYDDDHAMIIITGSCLTYSDGSSKSNSSSSIDSSNSKNQKPNENAIEITNLSYIANGHIDSYLGLINIFLIRESTQIKENGGLSGFMHCFISEVMALTRAHVLSLGGNALVSFKMNECVLLDNPHRNQGQCLINVSGDAVKVVRNK